MTKAASSTRTREGTYGFVIAIVSIAAYAMFAEQVGFVLSASAIILILMLWLGTRPLPALCIVAIFVPVLYVVFAQVLRVPLPHGWLG